MTPNNLWHFYKQHVHPLAFALSRAQQRGVLVDKARMSEIRERKTKELKTLHTSIKDVCKHDLNPNSPVQVMKLLYDELRFPSIYKDGKRTANEATLRLLEKKYPNEPILSLIIDYRKATKLIGTYLNPDKVSPDGRMRTSWNASGTETGRLSSSQLIDKTGMDLQNIPVGKSRGVENIRDIFIAGEGNVFVKCDLSQAETRVVACILRRVGDDTLFNLYRSEDFDIHSWMSEAIFNKSSNEASSHEREIGKLSNHSGNYGAGPKVLQNRALKDGLADIDYPMAQRMIQVRHKAIPGLRKWWRDVESRLRSTRTLTTCLGRRRIFFGRLDEATFRDGYAYEPQSTVGDVCNIIFTQLDGTLKEGYPILQVHDEVVVECPEDRADYVVGDMKKVSIIPLWINEDVPLIIPLDFSVGPNWKDMEDYD